MSSLGTPQGRNANARQVVDGCLRVAGGNAALVRGSLQHCLLLAQRSRSRNLTAIDAVTAQLAELALREQQR
jgi:hypothetical protein